jgi:hypothetical protein
VEETRQAAYTPPINRKIISSPIKKDGSLEIPVARPVTLLMSPSDCLAMFHPVFTELQLHKPCREKLHVAVSYAFYFSETLTDAPCREQTLTRFQFAWCSLV